MIKIPTKSDTRTPQHNMSGPLNRSRRSDSSPYDEIHDGIDEGPTTPDRWDHRWWGQLLITSGTGWVVKCMGTRLTNKEMVRGAAALIKRCWYVGKTYGRNLSLIMLLFGVFESHHTFNNFIGLHTNFIYLGYNSQKQKTCFRYLDVSGASRTPNRSRFLPRY